MNRYVVILLDAESNTNEMRAKLKAVDPAVYEHYASSGVYFVRFSGTAQQLSEKVGIATVGFASEHEGKTGIVIGVTQYFGYANNDLWNWLATP